MAWNVRRCCLDFRYYDGGNFLLMKHKRLIQEDLAFQCIMNWREKTARFSWNQCTLFWSPYVYSPCTRACRMPTSPTHMKMSHRQTGVSFFQLQNKLPAVQDNGIYQAPYSSDVEPCDFPLFPKFKLPHHGRRFESIETPSGPSWENDQRILWSFSDLALLWLRKIKKNIQNITISILRSNLNYQVQE